MLITAELAARSPPLRSYVHLDTEDSRAWGLRVCPIPCGWALCF